MLPDLAPVEWLTIINFSIVFGGFVLRLFISNPSARSHLIVAIAVVALVALGINAFYFVRHAYEIRPLSERIIEKLGNGEKTIDQLLIELNNPDLKVFARTIALLESEGRLDNRIEEFQLTRQQIIQVRLWRVKKNVPNP